MKEIEVAVLTDMDGTVVGVTVKFSEAIAHKNKHPHGNVIVYVVQIHG